MGAAADDDRIQKTGLLNGMELSAGNAAYRKEEEEEEDDGWIRTLWRGKGAEKCVEESKKTWQIAAPAILTAVAQFSIELVTAAFVGHLGTVELAAVSIVQNVLEGFVYGIMVSLMVIKLYGLNARNDCHS